MARRLDRPGEVGWRAKNGEYLQHETFLFAIPIRRTTQQEEYMIQRYTSSESTSVVVGGYVRRSSEMQKVNYSIDAQKRAIIEGCKLRGLPEPIFYEDDERSARREQIARRPAFYWTKPSIGSVSVT
jgi:hypothetical protein